MVIPNGKGFIFIPQPQHIGVQHEGPIASFILVLILIVCFAGITWGCLWAYRIRKEDKTLALFTGGTCLLMYLFLLFAAAMQMGW